MLAERPWEFDAIGTRWNIHLPQNMPAEQLTQLQESVSERISYFDAVYSRFREDSLVAEMARTAGMYQLPDDAQQLLNFYRDLYQATDGLVTPLIGQALVDAGYDATYSLTPGTVVKPPRWEDVIVYDFPKLELLAPALLDFGAAGKGYLVDLIAELLESNGINEYIVDAGGDMRLKSAEEAYKIGLEHPNDPNQVIGIAELAEGSICGSAINRRAWGDWHHVINPETQQPVQGVLSVWVTAAEARIADGLATALFFTDSAQLRERLPRYPFEYVMVREDLSVEASKDFHGTLFTH